MHIFVDNYLIKVELYMQSTSKTLIVDMTEKIKKIYYKLNVNAQICCNEGGICYCHIDTGRSSLTISSNYYLELFGNARLCIVVFIIVPALDNTSTG